MGEGNFFDIILLAMVAAFIFLRLRSVLGRRTGNERQRSDKLRLGGKDDNVVQLPKRDAEDELTAGADAALWAEDSPVGAGLTQIKIADHSFEPGEFLSGARSAVFRNEAARRRYD